MLTSDAYDQRFAARLQEFWAWSTPWHRRLWNVGSIAAIRELLEASDSLPPTAIKAMQAEVDRLVGPDIAIGPAPVRETLHALLTDTLTFRGANWHQLNELMFFIDAGYLKRWKELFGQTIQQGKPGYERAARSVAAHLLQSGFSPTYLHRWLNYQVRGRPDALASADFVHEAEVALVHKPSIAFRVVLPVLSAPKVAGAPPKEWLPADEIARLISAIQGAKSSVRQNGGFVLTIEARDQYAAVDKARELIDRWDARAELSVRERIVRTDKAWVEGVTDPILCTPTRRRVGITALRTQNQIYSPLDPNEQSIRIDDAFQLVQPMQAGPRSAAISGGWAAIESLLTVRGEAEHVAAQRLASIVACSYPRAELTNLSYVHAANSTDAVAVALQLEERISSEPALRRTPFRVATRFKERAPATTQLVTACANSSRLHARRCAKSRTT